MKILIIGFQRSGTTLMRRIVQGHPDIKRIFHESFFLKKYLTKQELLKFISKKNINVKKDNWGEKVPFYPNFQKYPTLKYCDTWNEWFGDDSRILHIIRHPVDIAFSVVNKYKNKNFDMPINLYRTKMVKYIPLISLKKNTFTFKYEDLLMNSDILLPKIFEFCKVDKDVDFRKYLLTIPNSKYTKLDQSRVFAYKKKEYKLNYDLTEVLDIANKIDGPEYEI